MTIKMYRIEGMMCEGCVATVKSAIKSMPTVIEAQIQLTEPQAIISMREDTATENFMQTLSQAGDYFISEIEDIAPGTKKRQSSPKKINKALGVFKHKKACCK